MSTTCLLCAGTGRARDINGEPHPCGRCGSTGACQCCQGEGNVLDIDGHPRPCSRCRFEAFDLWAKARRRRSAS